MVVKKKAKNRTFRKKAKNRTFRKKAKNIKTLKGG